MGIYEVLLGIDRAARDTRRRMTVEVLAGDRLSAAIAAERIGDARVAEPSVEYTHAMSVRLVNQASAPRPAAAAALPLAA